MSETTLLIWQHILPLATRIVLAFFRSRILGLDHTLITRGASVGGIGQKDRPASTWNQLLTTGSD